MLGERHDQARPYEHWEASNEGRTRDLALTKRMLCQLSYRGEAPAVSAAAAALCAHTERASLFTRNAVELPGSARVV